MNDIDDLKVKADKGNIEAQKTLGMMYANENNKGAIKWLRKAALKGDEQAAKQLMHLADARLSKKL